MRRLWTAGDRLPFCGGRFLKIGFERLLRLRASALYLILSFVGRRAKQKAAEAQSKRLGSLLQQIRSKNVAILGALSEEGDTHSEEGGDEQGEGEEAGRGGGDGGSDDVDQRVRSELDRVWDATPEEIQRRFWDRRGSRANPSLYYADYGMDGSQTDVGIVEGVPEASLRKILGKCPICSLLQEQELAFLATRIRMVSYPSGSVLMREGEAGDRLFAVCDGGLEVSMGGERLTEIVEGQVHRAFPSLRTPPNPRPQTLNPNL